MPKKKKARKKRSYRRNPSPRRKAVALRVRQSFAGLNYRTALRNIPLGVIGMFVTKWAAKRGTPDALEADPATWNGMTYLKGGLGATAAGYVANMVKPGSGQKVLEGGLMLLLYKAVQNHLIPKNDFLMSQFGQASPRYTPGDVEVNEAGEPFILGQDGQTWIPLDEGQAMPELMGAYGQDEDWEMMGDVLETPGRLGDVLETPGRLGQATSAAYTRALFES
jgi:hypothetical protein